MTPGERMAWTKAARLAMKIAKTKRSTDDAKRLAGYVLYLAAQQKDA